MYYIFCFLFRVVLKELIDALDKNITALEAKTITNDLKSSDDVDVSTNNDALGCSELIKNCRESLTSIQEVIRT